MPRADFGRGSGVQLETWQCIQSALDSLEVPNDLAAELRDLLPEQMTAVLLYGSRARGDATSTSDLDVLVVGARGNVDHRARRVNISFYSADQLTQSSQTLFGFHLARDGVVLLDNSGELRRILDGLEPPEPSVLIEKIRVLSTVLDIAEPERTLYLPGLVRVARYLVRSALYARALEADRPCFSVRELADREADPALVALLSSDRDLHAPDSPDLLADLSARLERHVGSAPINSFGGLEALIVGAWAVNEDLSNLALLALGEGSEEIPYDQIPKVVL